MIILLTILLVDFGVSFILLGKPVYIVMLVFGTDTIKLIINANIFTRVKYIIVGTIHEFGKLVK